MKRLVGVLGLWLVLASSVFGAITKGKSVTTSGGYINVNAWVTGMAQTMPGTLHKTAISIKVVSPTGRVQASSKNTSNNADNYFTLNVSPDGNDLGTYHAYITAGVTCPFGALTSMATWVLDFDIGTSHTAYKLHAWTQVAQGIYLAEYAKVEPCYIKCPGPDLVKEVLPWANGGLPAYLSYHKFYIVVFQGLICIPGSWRDTQYHIACVDKGIGDCGCD